MYAHTYIRTNIHICTYIYTHILTVTALQAAITANGGKALAERPKDQPKSPVGVVQGAPGAPGAPIGSPGGSRGGASGRQSPGQTGERKKSHNQRRGSLVSGR